MVIFVLGLKAVQASQSCELFQRPNKFRILGEDAPTRHLVTDSFSFRYVEVDHDICDAQSCSWVQMLSRAYALAPLSKRWSNRQVVCDDEIQTQHRIDHKKIKI